MGNVNVWGWPQYVEIGLLIVMLLSGAVVDGEPRKGKHDFRATVLGALISFVVLYCGGFWG